MPRKRPPKRNLVVLPKNAPADVTQADLERLADLQAHVYETQINCTRMALAIEERVRAGAAVQEGSLVWDKRLRMARSKKHGKVVGE